MFSRRDGGVHCEGVRLGRLLSAGRETPFFVYSRAQLVDNWRAYEEATAGLPALIGYAIKANHNPVLLRLLAGWGAGAVVASKLELRHALCCGFPAERVLMHGNGKRRGDLVSALRAGVLLSIDSPFDLRHVRDLATAIGARARVLFRVNPDIDPQVHPYISTGMHEAKFGMAAEVVVGLLAELGGPIELRGLHSHIGSALMEPGPFVDAARIVLALFAELRRRGHPLDTLDLGGGLGIDYSRGKQRVPTPAELIAPLRGEILDTGAKLILEPGRSLVGNAGALIGRVIGVKRSPRRGFIVVDASMAQLIRPSLYGAYHHIELLEAAFGEEGIYDVVGPLCESADFLGQGRRLGEPREGDGVIIHDAGAYGYSMASRYNLHLLPAEYLIDGERVRVIRRAERYEDFAAAFADEEVEI